MAESSRCARTSRVRVQLSWIRSRASRVRRRRGRRRGKASAYKATKAALIAYTQQLAIQNAEFGVRANVILPGLIDTPMAVESRCRWTAARWWRSADTVAVVCLSESGLH